MPEPSLFRRAAYYAGVALAAMALVAVGYRLDAHDLRVPLLYHDPHGIDTDSLLILPMVKATLERGSHWRCEHLGAPGIQELHDFPVIDHFHFWGIWLLGQVWPDPFLVFNLFFLLTYPLAALTATAVLRHFRLGFAPAAVGGLLFAFAPYHFFRGENHYFLSAYYMVPITSMVILWVCAGRLPFFPGGRFRLRDRDTLAAIAIGVVTASAGAYYAFFACGLLAGAGLYGWVAQRTWKAFASAVLVAAVIGAAGIANHAPAFLYQAKYGKHTAPTERFTEEAEFYGLKLAQLVLPIEDHSLETLAFVKSTWNSVDRPSQSWTERYSLGIVGTAGLLLLLVRAALPFPRREPFAALAALVLIAILIGTNGGFGAVFNHVVSPQVRCYNRIAVYILFFCLYAVLFALEGWIARWKDRFRHGRRLGTAVWLAVAWLGLWDQTPFYWGGPRTAERNADQCRRFAEDRQFFAEVEDLLNPAREPNGPMVFQLPYVRWPESAPVHNLYCYEHARGYMHTQTLRWSFGSMKGRETDEWYRRVAVLPTEQMLEHAAKAGFEAILLDKRGYTPARAEALHQQLNRVLGGGRQVAHADGKQILFDLRPYRDWLRPQFGRAWDDECKRELNRVWLLWLHGWYSFKEPGYEWMHRWCGTDGLLIMVNPTDEPKSFTTTFHIRTEFAEPAELTIRGDVWNEDLALDKATPLQTRTFVVPPGRHEVRFRCKPPATFIPTNPRKLFFFIAGLKAE